MVLIMLDTLIRKAKLVVIVTGVVVGGYVVYKYFKNKSEKSEAQSGGCDGHDHGTSDSE
jgi:hypothetical protein